MAMDFLGLASMSCQWAAACGAAGSASRPSRQAPMAALEPWWHTATARWASASCSALPTSKQSASFHTGWPLAFFVLVLRFFTLRSPHVRLTFTYESGFSFLDSGTRLEALSTTTVNRPAEGRKLSDNSTSGQSRFTFSTFSMSHQTSVSVVTSTSLSCTRTSPVTSFLEKRS
uniref:Putative secreted protein n=1 Tax=Ixodes ricinus TaxID=34613 RepID=A0A147BXN9_IXORI